MSKPRRKLKSTASVPFAPAVDPNGLATTKRAARQMLVVEPDLHTRRSLVEHYRAQGWRVCSAQETRQAIDLALELQPDVIIAEYYIPNVEARHLLRTLRSSVDHDVVIIGLARRSPFLLERTRVAAADIVLPKPIDLSAIDAFVRTRL